MRSLIVEDDFSSRAFLQKFLSRYGECDIAVDGEEAVNAFCQATRSGQPYGLICMDIRLPGIDGIEAVRRIREIEEENGVLSTWGVRILMTTGTGNPDTVVDSFQALCDGYYVKPIDISIFQNELRRLGMIPPQGS